MDKFDNLTTEKLRQKFKSQFELVNYSIRLAENMIKSGREPRVRMDLQNSAMQVLGEIVAGVDKIDEIIEPAPTAEKSEGFRKRESFADEAEEGKKPAEKKKRKILA